MMIVTLLVIESKISKLLIIKKFLYNIELIKKPGNIDKKCINTSNTYFDNVSFSSASSYNLSISESVTIRDFSGLRLRNKLKIKKSFIIFFIENRCCCQ